MLDLKKIRKALHQIPEIGFEEVKTTAYIEKIVKKWDNLKIIKFDFPGILCEYRVKDDNDYILFRADMDALPLTEETECEFASKHIGKMHACGHDIHMTVLIGLIEKVISQKVNKNILFLFQPAEEGKGGAERIIKTGIFANYNIKETYALHVSGDYPVGTIASKAGIIFGIPQEFLISFLGQGAHVAFPHKGKDALLASMHFYQSMLTAISHRFSPMDPIMFHIGKMSAGNVMNQIPTKAVMEGTFRVHTKENREALRALMKNTLENANNLYGTKSELSFPSTFDPVVNSGELVEKLKHKVPKNITYIECETQMTGEDFGFFTSDYKGCLFWLGCGVGEGLHSPKFLPDENCIQIGIDVLFSLIEA